MVNGCQNPSSSLYWYSTACVPSSSSEAMTRSTLGTLSGRSVSNLSPSGSTVFCVTSACVCAPGGGFIPAICPGSANAAKMPR